MSRSYHVPFEIDPATLRKSADRRRKALAAAGCSTYATGLRAGTPSIVCLCCGLGSVNFHDIEERYCGFCHAFHVEEQPE